MKPALSAALAVAALTFAGTASAQLKWEASGSVGTGLRLKIGGPGAQLGPAFGLDAHVALLPLVRVGGYLAHDIAPEDGAAARRAFGGGARVKLMSPWPRGDFQGWIFAGFGYSGVTRAGYRGVATASRTPGEAPVPQVVDVASAGGGLFEVPFGIGAAYRVARPWKIQLELSGRPSVGAYGSVYGDRPTTTLGGVRGFLPASDRDAFGFFAVLGLGYEP